MAFFKRRQRIHDDFGYEDLPHNRFQVFKTLFRIRLGFLLKVLGITCLFLLPLLAWNTYGRLTIRVLLAELTSENQNQIYPQIYGFLVIRSLVCLPLFYPAVIGLGGMVRVYRKLAWSEITFLSDYFDGLKKNLLRYAFLTLVCWFSYAILLFALYSIKALNLQPLMTGMMVGVSFLQFGFLLIFGFYFLLQNDIYKIDFFHLVSNSFKFVFKSFLASLGLMALLFSPRLCVVFGNFYFDLLSTLLVAILLCPVALAHVLISCAQLDKWINKNLYKAIYDKGIYRLG